MPLLWGAYMPLPAYGIVDRRAWQWVFVAPVFIAVGAAVAWACFDLDFGCGRHALLFLRGGDALLLRAAVGLPPLWAGRDGYARTEHAEPSSPRLTRGSPQ